MLDSPTVVDPGGPDPLTSSAYALDLAEVQLIGSATSTARTAAETQTAHFFNVSVPVQLNTAMRQAAAGLDLRRAAQLFGLANVSAADAIIGCWRQKYEHPFWRPITAIREAASDGNARTHADPTWTSLSPAPPYPDWPSGHGCLMGAYTQSLQLFHHSDRINLVLGSVVGGAEVSRSYTSAELLEKDAFYARIWLGIHFRDAMEDANYLGEKTARLVAHRLGSDHGGRDRH